MCSSCNLQFFSFVKPKLEMSVSILFSPGVVLWIRLLYQLGTLFGWSAAIQVYIVFHSPYCIISEELLTQSKESFILFPCYWNFSKSDGLDSMDVFASMFARFNARF